MKRVVSLLLSDKRSGSTMLQNELCKHSAVNHVDYSPHKYFETHHWLQAACILEKSHSLFYGHKRHTGYGSVAAARQYMIDCIRGNVPDFEVPGDDEQLIFRGWEALCRRFADPIFFEKSPQYPPHWAALDLLLEWTGRTEFDVRFICLVRNPMAVMYSASFAFHGNPEERQFLWATAYLNLLALRAIVGDDAAYTLRYEDLVEHPREKLSDVCDFLGFKYEEGMGNSIHRESTRKWVNDPGYDLQLDPAVRRVAGHFGYSEQDLYNPPKPGLSLSRKLYRRLSGRAKLFKAHICQKVLKPLALGTWKRK